MQAHCATNNGGPEIVNIEYFCNRAGFRVVAIQPIFTSVRYFS